MDVRPGIERVARTVRRRPTVWGAVGASLLLLVAVIALAGSVGGASRRTAAVPSSAATAPAASPLTTTTEAARLVDGKAVPATTLPSWLIKQRAAEAAAQATEQTTVSADGTPTSTTTQHQTTSNHPATSTILRDGRTPLRGLWDGNADRLAAFLLAESPRPAFSVSPSTLAGYYVRYCAEAGLRADLLWAQMLHETGYGRYGGAVSGAQNNFAGIGATGGSEPGVSFPTAEAGVMAHVAHMVAYVYEVSPVAWAGSASDPRFDQVMPRGAATVLADLNGRWAVPGTSYGQRIEDIARAINTR